MHYLTIFVSTRCQKLSNSFICHSDRLTEKRMKCVGGDIRKPTVNVIRVKFNIAINVDASVQHV